MEKYIFQNALHSDYDSSLLNIISNKQYKNLIKYIVEIAIEIIESGTFNIENETIYFESVLPFNYDYFVSS